MNIVALTTENANGRRFITVRAMLGEREALEAENMTVLQDLIAEADERLGNGGNTAKDDGDDEKPKGRGRGRPRGSTAKDKEPEEEAPVRRRRAAPEPETDDEISDTDLVKACSDAADKCKAMAKLIPVILTEDFGVKSTDKLEGDDRQKFLDAVAEELAAQLSDD